MSATPVIPLDPRGVKLVSALAKGDWAAAEAMFAPSLQNALSAEKVAQAWTTTTAKVGAFKEVASTRSWKKGDRETLVVTAKFEGGLIDVKASYLDDAPEKTTLLYFTAADAAARAMSVLLPFVKGDAGPVHSHFDDKAKEAISPEILAEGWKSANDALGEFEYLEDAKTQSNPEYDVVTVGAQFKKARAEIFVVFHSGSDRIAKFQMKPVAPPPDPAPPSYAHPDMYEEQPALVGKGERALPATLTIPKGKGPFPGVILVHGSGPHDRDETVEAQRPFRDIALGLASRGIAVLRYEKRTYGKNAATLAAVLPHLTVREETVDDAIDAIHTLRAADRIDQKRIYVIGHSLGAMLAPMIVEKDRSVAGMIVLAGPARPFEDVILEQLTRGPAPPGSAAAAEADALREKVARVKSPDLTAETPSSELPLAIVGSYWLALRGYDPVARAAKLAKPILVLRGENDVQVLHEDFAMWQAKLGKSKFATLAEIPGVGHLYTEGAYDKPIHVVEPVITQMADWILARH